MKKKNKKSKSLKRNSVKSTWKLKLIESKQIEYIKKIIKESLLEVHGGKK